MKILIYLNKNELNNSGGPLGYCNTLYQENAKNDNSEIFFLERPIVKRSRLYKFLSKIPFLKSFKRYLFYKNLLNDNVSHLSSDDLNQFDIIHFHLTQDMYSIRDSLKDYRGKIVLTSHSPIPASLEAMVDIGPLEKAIFKKTYSRLIEMDKYSFKRSNIWLFPCEESEESYHDLLPSFEDLKKDKKVYYLPTGIHQKYASKTRTFIRQKYNIPDDAFVISYVGRHNTVKGYDKLKEIGKMALEKNPNLYIVVAGKEKPIRRLKNNRCIEIGWTNDPHSIIAASDLFLLPNKHTYFDLVLLEVLSLGKVVLLSNTGGNKYFGKLNSSGIFLFNNNDEALNIVLQLSTVDKRNLDRMAEDNLLLFKKAFTAPMFYDNYLNFYKKIYEDL